MLTELIFGSPAAPRLRYVCLIAAGFAVQSCWPGANPGSRPTDAVCFHGLLPARGPSLSKGHRAASDNQMFSADHFCLVLHLLPCCNSQPIFPCGTFIVYSPHPAIQPFQCQTLDQREKKKRKTLFFFPFLLTGSTFIKIRIICKNATNITHFHLIMPSSFSSHCVEIPHSLLRLGY